MLLDIFISLLYMFRATTYPSSGENYCIYATLVFFTQRHPYRVTSTSVEEILISQLSKSTIQKYGGESHIRLRYLMQERHIVQRQNLI